MAIGLGWRNRIEHTVASYSGGNITLGAATSGNGAFVAGDDGIVFTVGITDGTAYEAGQWLYTHSGTILSRQTREASSSGANLTVSAGATVFHDATAAVLAGLEYGARTQIEGLLVTKGSGNTINVSAGSAYVPAARASISYAGGANLSAGTLGASQWNQVFLSESGAIEVTNNADPPTTTYAGNARQGGTNSNRRWIGAFLTNGSSNIRTVQVSEFAPNLYLSQYTEDINSGAPFRVLSAGGSTTWASVSLSGIVPRYVTTDVLFNAYITTDPAGSAIGLSNDGVSLNIGTIQSPPVSVGAFLSSVLWAPPERQTPKVYYSVGSGQAAYLDAAAYKVAR